jgi:hypothetical protein
MRKEITILAVCILAAALMAGCACHSVQTTDECRFRSQQPPPEKACAAQADSSAEDGICVKWVLEKGWELLLSVLKLIYQPTTWLLSSIG